MPSPSDETPNHGPTQPPADGGGLDRTLPVGGADRTMPSAGADRTIPPSAADEATVPPQAGRAEPRAEARLERIGDCRIEKRLGSGGFGDVWLAVQENNLLKRRVAIKLLKRGMDSEAVLERFELERKVLDSLNHPNIARLLGGGVTDDGRSYFIMEFVEGLTLDLWCQRQGLKTEERLKLLRQVASALAHAHERGIVHRDIKPANVLVGADGVPKLLDFGIAKIIHAEPGQTDRSRQTLPGEVGPLTPVYASPEQLRGEPLNASTDVYSMGVMMYEVLSGAPPFDFSRSNFDEVRRQVCEVMPPNPSETAWKVLKGADTRASTTLRASDVSRLRGDVDNIVLMAMRKETQRRYASMEDLIADIDAHLEGRPVSARALTITYRASKWVSRNRAGVLVATISLAALLVVGGVWGWMRHQRLSEQRAADAAASTRRDKLNSDESKLATDPEALAALAEAETRARRRMQEKPEDLAAMRDLRATLRKKAALLERMRNLKDGLPVTGELLKIARDVRARSTTDEDRREFLTALQARGDMLQAGTQFDEARKVYEENLQERRAWLAEKPDDAAIMRLVTKAIVRQRDMCVEVGEWKRAIELDRELLALRSRILKLHKDSSDAKDVTARLNAQRDWMLAHWFLACDSLADDDLVQASFAIESMQAIAKDRLAKDGENWERHFDMALVHEVGVQLALQRDELEAARAEAERWLEAERAAMQLSQSENLAVKQFVSAGVELALVLNALGRHEDALRVVRSTVTEAERLRAGDAGRNKGQSISDDQRLKALAEEIRALSALARASEVTPLVERVELLLAQPGEGLEWSRGLARVSIAIARAQADPVRAEAWVRRAMEQQAKVGDRIEEAALLEQAAELFRKINRPNDATAAAARACELAKGGRSPRAASIAKRCCPQPAPTAPAPAPAPAPTPAPAPASPQPAPASATPAPVPKPAAVPAPAPSAPAPTGAPAGTARPGR
jgi:serine/threonine protein kinase